MINKAWGPPLFFVGLYLLCALMCFPGVSGQSYNYSVGLSWVYTFEPSTSNLTHAFEEVKGYYNVSPQYHGPINYSVGFDGGQSVNSSMPFSKSLESVNNFCMINGTQDRTTLMWVYPLNSGSGFQGLLIYGAGNDGKFLFTSTYDEVSLINGALSCNSHMNLVDDEWNFVGARLKGTQFDNVTLFLANSDDDFNITNCSGTGLFNTSPLTPLYLGYTDGTNYWDGLYDDVHTWDRALSFSEIENFFRNNLSLANDFEGPLPPGPNISLNNVSNDKGSFVIPGNISFIYGNWSFGGVAVNVSGPLSWVSEEIRNNSHIIFFRNESDNFDFVVNGSVFVDFGGNNFNYSVKAQGVNSRVSHNSSEFTVIDTINPFCSGLVSVSVENNTNYSFNIHCVDDNFYSLELNASNGFYHLIKDINAPYFDYLNITLIEEDTLIHYRFCDGHTRTELKQDSFHKLKDKKITFNSRVKGVYKNVSFYALSSVPESVEVTRKKDRISFDFRFQNKGPKIKTFVYESSEEAVYVESEVFPGWIIDPISNTWFDAVLVDDPSAVVSVERIDVNQWLIRIDSDKDTIRFSSIGELNCVSGTYLVSAVIPSVPVIKEFEGLTQLIYYFGMTLFWFVCVLALFVVKGVHGGPVQVFNVMQFLLGFFVSLLWLNFSVLLFLVILGPAVVVFLGFLKKA